MVVAATVAAVVVSRKEVIAATLAGADINPNFFYYSREPISGSLFCISNFFRAISFSITDRLLLIFKQVN